MSLWVKVNCNFYTHRKTAKLRGLIGDAALWVPPRLWAYAAENQPDGIFKDYTATEIAGLIGYQGDAFKMLEALLQARFLDAEPLRIHDWQDYNGYHQAFAERAKKAADARWQKERTKEKGEESTRGEKSQAMLVASPQQAAQPRMLGGIPLSERITLEKSLDRVMVELKGLDGTGLLPKAAKRKQELQAEGNRLRGLLNLKV